jgi:predicted permease
MMTTWNDLKYGLRMLAKTPGFAGVAVLTLALCLGANLAIFAVVDGVLLRPLPFPQPQRLAALYNVYPKLEPGRSGSSLPNLYLRRGKIEALSSVAAYKLDVVTVGEGADAGRVEILRVSPDFLETLGIAPLVGRSFTEEEMTFQTHHVAMVSYAYWREHFDADPGVLGRSVRVNGFDKTIVGVLPVGFRFLSSQAQILLPLSSDPGQRGINNLHNSADCEMIGRLRPRATWAQAQAQIDAHNAALAPDFPYAKQVEASGFRTLVVSLHADHVEPVRPTLVLLQAGGLFLLLVGALNLVNLMLVRAGARTKELAVRQSLGANRLRVVRQVLTETVLLTLLGGLGGLAIGTAGVRLLAVLGVDRPPLNLPVALDGRVTLTALLGAVVLGFILAVPTAWFNLRGPLVQTLQAQTRGSTVSHAVQRLRHGLVGVQIALAFILLTGAGLLAVSLERTMEVSPGFRPDHVLAGHISMLHKNYLDGRVRMQFAERVLGEIRGQPSVLAVGLASNMPVGGKESGNQRRVMTVARRGTAPSDLPIVPNIYAVVGDYFRALGIPLQAGRLFDGSESRREERVCLVDETFAQRNWPEVNPVGQLVYDGAEVKPAERPFTVIGVVGAVKQTELTEAAADGTNYFTFRDSPLTGDSLHVVVRTAQRPEAIAPVIQKAVRAIEPELPINDLRTMETRIADTLLLRRCPALLAGLFASVALLLAAVGTYGVLSFAVAQRRREIAVRMALGAWPGQIGRQFLTLGLRLLLVGTILGVAGAFVAGRAMQSLLFGVGPLDPVTLISVTLIMGVVSLLACWLPARRAARVDPMTALRCE